MTIDRLSMNKKADVISASKKRALATPPITPGGEKKRRLSVVPEDAESSPKRPTSAHPGQAVVDQVRHSMKLKEQQKALIEARRGSVTSSAVPQSATTPKKNIAGLSIWTSGAPSEGL